MSKSAAETKTVIRLISSDEMGYPRNEFFLQLVCRGDRDFSKGEMILNGEDIITDDAGNVVRLFCKSYTGCLHGQRCAAVLVRAVVEKVPLPCWEEDNAYALYRLVGGSALIPCDKLFDNDYRRNVWREEHSQITSISLSSEHLELGVRRNPAPTQERQPEDIVVRHRAREDRREGAFWWRFWELAPCSKLTAAKLVETRLAWLPPGKSANSKLPVAAHPISDSPPRVVYLSPTDPAKHVREAIALRITLEFIELPNRPRWTPNRLVLLPDQPEPQYIFSDHDLLDTGLAPSQEFSLEWTKDNEQYRVDAITQAPLGLATTSTPAANRSGTLWQYAVVKEPEGRLAPGWIGYPLPTVEPPHRLANPRRLNLTSSMETALVVGGNTEWRFAAKPLDSASGAGHVSFVVNVSGGNVEKLSFGGRSDSFELEITTPFIYAYNQPLSDPQSVPAPAQPTTRLTEVQLQFRNIDTTTLDRRSLVLKLNKREASFQAAKEFSFFHGTGRALLQPLSPAGSNVLVVHNNSSEPAASLPDASRGLAEQRVGKDEPFSLDFPNRKGGALEELLGQFYCESATTVAGTAIHPLHPWSAFHWTARLPTQNPASVDNWRLYHRNLLTELAEFFRRQGAAAASEKPSRRPSYEAVAHLVRDQFAVAAEFGSSPQTPVPVQNFLPAAEIPPKEQLMVHMEINNGWPVAVVQHGAKSSCLEAFRQQPETAPSGWLAYNPQVTWDARKYFPTIQSLSPRAAPWEQHQFQTLIVSEQEDFHRVFDNAGTVRLYGDGKVIRSEKYKTLRIQPLCRMRPDGTTHWLFALDCSETLLGSSDQGNEIYLFCKGLLLEESSEGIYRYRPVSDEIASEIGGAGVFRLGRKADCKDETISQGAWPRVGYVPLCWFGLGTTAFTFSKALEPGQPNEPSQPNEPVDLISVQFEAVLPSPRDLAFQKEIELPSFACRAINARFSTVGEDGQGFSEGSKPTLTCTVVPAAKPDEQVTATGGFLWNFARESPRKFATATVDTGDGIHEMLGTATFTVGTCTRGTWKLQCPRPKAIASVLGALMPTGEDGVWDLGYTFEKITKTWTAATNDFDKAKDGFKFTSQQEKIPEYQLTVPIDGRQAEIKGRYNGTENYDQQCTLHEDEVLALRGVDGIFNAFVARDKFPATLFWLDRDTPSLRTWKELPPQEISADLCVDGETIAMRGILQEMSIDGLGSPNDGSPAETYFSGLFQSTGADSPDSIRILFLGQRWVETNKITAQISIDIRASADDDGGSSTGRKLAGTVRLSVDRKEGYKFMLDNAVHDFSPMATVNRGERTTVDVYVPPVTALRRSGGWSDAPSQSIDLQDLAAGGVEADPFLGVWKISPAFLAHPEEILPHNAPMGAEGDAIVAQGRDAPVLSTIPGLPDGPPAQEQQATQDIEKANPGEEATEISGLQPPEDPLNPRFVSSMSSKGTLFVARHGNNHGFLYVRQLEGKYAEPVRLDFPGETLQGAAFSGDSLLILTLKKVWVCKAPDRRLLMEFEDKSVHTSIVCDPLNPKDVVIGYRGTNFSFVRHWVFEGDELTLHSEHRLPDDNCAVVAWGHLPNNQPRSGAFVYHGRRVSFWPLNATSFWPFNGTDPRYFDIAAFSACSVVDGDNQRSWAVVYDHEALRDHLKLFMASNRLDLVGKRTLNTNNPRALGIAVAHGTPVIAVASGALAPKSDAPGANVSRPAEEPVTQLYIPSEKGLRLLDVSLRPAQRVDLQVTDSGELLATTLVEAGESVDVRVHRVAVKHLGCERVDDTQIAFDRCADGDAAIPPEDRLLSAPQMWHLQAAGLQLMSQIPDDWEPVAPPSRAPQPLPSDVDTWAVGPLVRRKLGTKREWAIVRNSLYVAPPVAAQRPNTIDLRTDTMIAMSRNGGMGVLANQTRLSGVNEMELEREWRQLLQHRGWQGLTLHRTLANDGPATLQLFRPERHRSARALAPLSAASSVLSSSARAFFDSRILPYDEWRQMELLSSSEEKALAADYDYLPGLATTTNLGRGQDLRRWSVARSSGRIPDKKKCAELLVGEISLFAELPRRITGFPPAIPMEAEGTPFLPAVVDFVQGPGKPGAMISSAIGVRIDRLHGPTAMSTLRDPLRLASPDTPQLVGKGLRWNTVEFRGTELPGLSKLDVEWDLEFPTVLVDDKDNLPLAVPYDDGGFLVYQNGTYGFKDDNRRIFALFSVVMNGLLERPIYYRKKSAWLRNPDSDPSLPLQMQRDENNDTVLWPGIYLVTKIPGLGERKQVTGGGEFEPVVSLRGVLLPFKEVFKEIGPIQEDSPYILWEARPVANRRPNSEASDSVPSNLEIFWRSPPEFPEPPVHLEPLGAPEPTIQIHPWSSVGETPSPLTLREVRGTSDPLNAIVVMEDGQEKEEQMVLAFDNITGQDVSRSIFCRLVERRVLHLEEKSIHFGISARYRASVETPVADTAAAKVRVCTTLALGEVVGSDIRPLRLVDVPKDLTKDTAAQNREMLLSQNE